MACNDDATAARRVVVGDKVLGAHAGLGVLLLQCSRGVVVADAADVDYRGWRKEVLDSGFELSIWLVNETNVLGQRKDSRKYHEQGKAKMDVTRKGMENLLRHHGQRSVRLRRR